MRTHRCARGCVWLGPDGIAYGAGRGAGAGRITSSQVLVEFLLLGKAPFVLPLSPQLTDVRDVARVRDVT